ncbi:hypothetical protein [Hansschlegelia sp.]|uniref:hypothetical protein n=1 Tax=Hansschlegelia sp. TaxID=2041892 RepID=UPI002C67C611|nr:hypothetical protein [Hansschlegelia sp.]HVI29621.1 hypothetical protein [Hansschlegelia sp.]
MLARLAARLLLAPLGFACGVLAGFAMLAFLTSKDLTPISALPDEIVLLGYDMSVSAATALFLLAPLMAAPAIVAVLIAEMFSIRSWAYHAVAGAVTATLPWALSPSGFDGPIFTAPEVVLCGLVGGLVHWLIAGRSSGLARRAEPLRD